MYKRWKLGASKDFLLDSFFKIFTAEIILDEISKVKNETEEFTSKWHFLLKHLDISYVEEGK